MALNLAAVSPVAESAAPGTTTQIRYLLKTERGDITHAVCPPGETSPVHFLPELFEAYYVLAGRGEIWRQISDREEITALRPGRLVQIPAGTRFQYRAYSDASLVFLVVVLPTWREELFHLVEGGPWTVGGESAPPTADERLEESWLSDDLPAVADCRRPDGSDIRRLGSTELGTMVHRTLNAGDRSTSVHADGVRELWYVIDGYGELHRNSPASASEAVPLWPGFCVSVEGDGYQLQSTGAGALHIFVLSMPGPARS